VGAPPSGFFIFVISVVSIDIIILGNRNRESVLSQAGLYKTIEGDPRERGSQSKSNFRMHARDEKKLFSAMQAFLLHFCNVTASQIATHLGHGSEFSHLGDGR